MSKKSDDSIERIFRQALTRYDTKFHEEDWSKMEKLLNAEAERKAAARSRRIKGTAYTLTGLTGLIIAVYFLAIKNPSASIGSLSDPVIEMQASEDLMENGNVKHENPSEGLLSQSLPGEHVPSSEGTSNNDATGKGFSESLPALDQAGKVKKNSPQGTDAGRSTLQRRPDEGNKNQKNNIASSAEHDYSRNQKEAEGSPGIKPLESYSNSGNDPSGMDLTNKNNPFLTTPVPAEDVEAVDDKFAKDDEEGRNIYPSASSGESGKGAVGKDQDPMESEGQSKANALPQSSAKEEALVEKESLDVDKKTITKDSASVAESAGSGKDKIKPSSRWSVAFVFAPEFSTTKLNSYSSPGESFGLRIAYQLTNRFSINTGLIRSTKKYEGSGDSYKPRNPAYWQIRTNGVVPEEIYSKCLVYELPLGVQFDAIQTSRSRVFVSAAISSYFMVSQVYDYTFHSPNPGADMSWRSPRSESYWFNVGMVSAGYERHIHRSFAIGIEPYLKFSLSKIGWPNIKLFSTGAYVTLRYKFMSRRDFN